MPPSNFRYNIAAELDPKNSGVLLVHLSGATAGQGSYRDAGFASQLSRQAGGDDEQVSLSVFFFKVVTQSSASVLLCNPLFRNRCSVSI